MAESIITDFEVIQIHIQNRSADIFILALFDQCFVIIHLLGKALTVEQSGQQIGHGALLELLVHLADSIPRL